MPEEGLVIPSPATAPREKLLNASLKHLIDSGVVAVVSWDASGRIQEANEYFLEVVGYSREELESGHLTWARLSPSDNHAVIEQLKQEGIVRGHERELVRRDGSRAFVRIHSALYGDPAKVVSVVVDVSEFRVATQRA